MGENWVKYPVGLGDDLQTGILTKDEFLLLSYMLNQCDRETGIIITNSRLLSIQVDADRKWVSNLLTSLKNKKRLQNPDRDKTELRQRRGNTKPYPILLCDALPNGVADRDKTETRQRQDRDKTDGPDRRKIDTPPEPAQSLDKTNNGNFLAERDLDLEEDKERTTTTEEEVVVSLPSASDEEEEPYPTIQSDATIIEGAILSKYRNQIMDRPPAPGKVRDALEAYPIDQLLEALDRAPIILKTKDPKSGIDGNYALSTACKYVDNPSWGRKAEDAGPAKVGNSKLDEVEAEVRKMKEELEKAKTQPENNADFIDQLQWRIELKEGWLNEHR